jgi:hypothetical protein
MTKDKTTDDGYAMRPIDVELYETCAKGTLAQVKALLDKGANPNAIHWIASESSQGKREYSGDHDYPVIQAAANKDPRVLALLLARGAEPNVSDGYLRQPLAIAAGAERYENVKRLLELGNDPNFTGVDGDTPCSWAANNRGTRILELLFEHGADPNNGGRGDYPLDQVLQYGNPARIRFFVEHGCSPQACDDFSVQCASLANVRALLECGFDPNTSIGHPREIRLVDLLSGRCRELFLRKGAVPFFHAGELFACPYDRLLFGSSRVLTSKAWLFAPYLSAGKGPAGRRSLEGSVEGDWQCPVRILVKETKKGKLAFARRLHLLLVERREACRKDTFRVTPFFKPGKDALWHASVEYGADRMPLDFVVADAFQDEAFERYSQGGVFEMRFMGLGASLSCLNRKGVIRFWEGLPVARERRDKRAPGIDHADVILDESRSLNPCGDDGKNPAFAEFTSTVEEVESVAICRQPCYRIRLWSGPPEDPAGFPWTLLIAKARVEKGWIPRVGDFVNGIAAMYGTFDGKAEDGAGPTVFQRECGGEAVPEPPIPKKDLPKAPKGKPSWEYLPRFPKEYPDAPAPRVPLPAFTDEPFKKFVTYPEYRRHLGDRLVPVAPPSRKRLKEIIGEIDHVITTDGNRRVFAPHFDAIGIRHAVRDPATGETHLWLGLPEFRNSRWLECHSGLLVALSPEGQPVRYTIHANDDMKIWRGWYCMSWCPKSGNTEKAHATAEECLELIPAMKKHAYFRLYASCHGSFFQAACIKGGKKRAFLVEFQIHGVEWQFGAENISEKRLLELSRLFIDGGLPAIENEEPWEQIKIKGMY